ncbi:hypothetical protein [Aequorivita marina]|uniref:hypothetical protein n=1 Tax=Aequorivita marina TaxID=3073654 RepID=UPI0028749515|nr:hypothetical protein [Aequorivita sp. S2608]MDS1297788.1 hypothetical protein [Aequorivita sp. S2608]
MKNSIKYLSILAIFVTCFMNAQENNMQKAIEKGKSDLTELLIKAGDNFNFGVKVSDVKKSEGKTGVPYKEIDFNKLLDYDGQELEQLLSSVQKFVVPLTIDNQVVTTISITQKEKGTYKPTELINQNYQNNLNLLPSEASENNFKDLVIIYVPNLNTLVYSAGDKVYTSYNNHSLSQGIEAKVLLQKLKADAKEFQEKYGELIKKGKLVN